ncbi:hypothetical protein VW23_018360 [Devosia insulae DS-56]|uniref:GIY-YIG domain-containing protein n=1 Tax=Devosia insulae DS-56 TaxID=1116389 RepID=A0A1E5XR16_9HYPH|nr:GIY-YIG nuclease family protein [Devosia insulae]OEO31052.1 hypothetical protein VW23_018360 [Devosia insulae DS-56]
MHAEQKKAALLAYKERKQQMGIYAVVCVPSGQTWVGQTRNLDKLQNRIWFALRLGSERPASLQDAWNTHGQDAFRYDVVAQLADAETAYPEAALKELLATWRDRLGAMSMVST